MAGGASEKNWLEPETIAKFNQIRLVKIHDITVVVDVNVFSSLGRFALVVKAET